MRFHDSFQLLVLGIWIGLGALRLVDQYLRGGHVLVVDRQRSIGEGLRDLTAVLCLIAWWYETVAYAVPLDTHVVPVAMRVTVLNPVEWLGRSLWLIAIILYVLAMWEMGDSWRIGIDRNRPGALIHGGIFRYSRNPIYLSFDIALLATFLCTGLLHFLVLLVLLAALLNDQIVREEHFLTATYGDAYRLYRGRVRRYL